MKKPKSAGKRLKSGDHRGPTKVSAQEALERMQSFIERKERFIASVRKGTNRDLPA